MIIFSNKKLQKAGLLQSLKSPVSQYLWNSQHVKGSETHLKPAQQYSCHISISVQKKISSKNSALVVSEILRLFPNKFRPDDKYSLSVRASV